LDRTRALRLLGLSETQARDTDMLRRAYRRRMREVHPDVNPDADAAEVTVSISRAYRLLSSASPHSGQPASRSGRSGPVGDRGEDPRERARRSASAQPGEDRPLGRQITVELLDDSSILVEEDRETTFGALLEAAHSLGEIGYLDRSAWLVEVLVEFVEAPTSSVVMTLQGRTRGTEVFCTVEPLSGGDSPPIGPVTELVARALAAVDRRSPGR
jgi:hypothetical protein